VPKPVASLDRLTEMFRHIPEHLTQQILRNAIKAGLEPIREAAAANIHTISGNLARSLQVTVRRTGTGDQLMGTFRTAKRGFYARDVEFGSKHAPAHPFLAPAFGAGIGEATQAIGVMLQDVLRDVLRKGVADAQ
jgi:HK97 gp10 family phage protein